MPPRAFLLAFAAAAIVGAAVFLTFSQPALAHANLGRASPAPNEVLQDAPSRVTIWFTEPIEPALSEIRVLDAAGSRVDDSAIVIDPNDPTVLSVGLPLLPNGVYTVGWKNVSRIDGHLVRGSYVFSVGQPIAGAAPGLPDEPLLQSPAEPAVRWLMLTSLLAMVGGVVFDLLVLRPAIRSRRVSAAARNTGLAVASRSVRLVGLAASIFLASSAAQLLLQASSIYEVPVGEAFGSPIKSTLLDTEWGRLWLWRVGLAAGFLAVLSPLWLPVGSLARFRDREVAALTVRLAALALGGAVLWTWSLTSHGAATAGIRGAALFSDYLHLAASAFWVGALFHLAGGIPAFRRISSRRDRRDLLGALIPRFSVVATLSVGTLIVTGVFNGWAQVTAPEAIDTPYGSALAVKTALVAVLLLFGALNLWWVRPRLARDRSSEGWLSRLVGVEVLLALLVLGSVGFLTSVEPARQVASRAGAGTPDVLNFQDTAEGVDISLEIAPGTVGANDLTVSLTDRLGNPIDNASVVDIRLSYLDADLGEETVPAGPGGDGSYLAAAQPLTIAGAWQAELIVRRPDAFDARTAFRFEIAAAAAQGSSAISPSPETAKIMLGVGLALLGLLFMGAGVRLGGWFSRTGAGVMAPGLAGFVVGVVLLVNTQLGQPEQPELRNPFPPNPVSLQAGRLVYQQHCETCHGPAGHGDGPSAAGLKPPPANLVVHVPLHADGDLFGFIHDGIEGTAMVPLGEALTDDEIWHVVNHIRTFEE